LEADRKLARAGIIEAVFPRLLRGSEAIFRLTHLTLAANEFHLTLPDSCAAGNVCSVVAIAVFEAVRQINSRDGDRPRS
jgi:hypothetical protein